MTNKHTEHMRLRNRYVLMLDILIVVMAYVLTVLTVFPIRLMPSYVWSGGRIILLTAIIYVSFMYLCGIYRTNWVYAGTGEYIKLLAACAMSAALSIAAGTFEITGFFFPKLNIAANSLTVCMIVLFRGFLRFTYKRRLRTNGKGGKKCIIIGGGRVGVMVLRDIYESKTLNYSVAGIIDDDPSLFRQTIYGASVIGNRNDIVFLCKELHVEEIIFAIYKISPKDKADILNICSNTGCKVKIIPGIDAILNGALSPSSMREIDIGDLLERDPIVLDNGKIDTLITDKTVLVTGGGGSIGSELCRQIMKFGPNLLVIFDIYENTTYELQNELEKDFDPQKIKVLIGSVRDKKRLNDVFSKYKPHIVFHAAAHKHVPLMEFSPGEAIKNNIFGTYNTAMCALSHNVRKFVLISSDKAVNPTNVMGATKRMCEIIVQNMPEGKTEFAAVRFGNVLGSHGSVIPHFKKQIAEGGPVTVTHPDITRFFMTIPEAAQLVLQAASYAKGGEIFILDMGKPVKIYDLAKKLILLSGLRPDKDIKIIFTGLRPGEKLYEELLMEEEGLTETEHRKIFIGKPCRIPYEELLQKLETLKNIAYADDDPKIKSIMADVIETYSSQI